MFHQNGVLANFPPKGDRKTLLDEMHRSWVYAKFGPDVVKMVSIEASKTYELYQNANISPYFHPIMVT